MKECKYNRSFDSAPAILNCITIEEMGNMNQFVSLCIHNKYSDGKLNNRGWLNMNMQRLKELIEQIDYIEKLFHPMGGNYSFAKEINDNPEYQEWLQEIILLLQEIYDRLHDQFIWSTINVLNQNMNGLNDEDIFNEIRGKLKVIGKHIDKYNPRNINIVEEKNSMEYKRKSPMVFISHSS